MASIKTCMPAYKAQLFEKMSCPKGATTSWIPDSLGQLQGDRSTTSIETTVCVGGAYHSLIVLRRRQWRLICFGIFKTRGNRLRAVPVSSSRVCGSSRFSARVRVKNPHPETPEQVADGGGKAEGAYAFAIRSVHCTALHTPRPNEAIIVSYPCGEVCDRGDPLGLVQPMICGSSRGYLFWQFSAAAAASRAKSFFYRNL